MKSSTLKTSIIAVISMVTGLVFGLTWHNWQEAKNEAPENGVEILGLTSTTEYAKENAFFSSYYTQPPAVTHDYNPKDRCRIEYLFQGSADNSRAQDIVVTLTNEPGTPGGTTAKAQGTHADFHTYRFKVISNREVSLEEMKQLAIPPKGWILGIWSTDKRYQPVARKTFDNCVPTAPEQTPKR